MREQDALLFFPSGPCGCAKMKLKRHGVQDSLPQLLPLSPLLSSRKSLQRDKVRRREVVAKVRKTRTSLLGQTRHLHPQVRENTKRITFLRIPYAFYIMELTEPLSALSGSNLLLLSKGKKNKREKGR